MSVKWVLMNTVGELYNESVSYALYFPRNTIHWSFSKKGQNLANVYHFLPNTKYLKKSYTTLKQVWVSSFSTKPFKTFNSRNKSQSVKCSSGRVTGESVLELLRAKWTIILMTNFTSPKALSATQFQFWSFISRVRNQLYHK